ncbi:MAG TPA: PqqD family protein [Gemmatimonadaceae bacterium]|nr:PqqD family protein [Gemmatimonadaceae bacterium]
MMLSAETHFGCNDAQCRGRVVDEDAAIVSLVDGTYYSMDGAGALVWSLVEQQRSEREIASAVAVWYNVAPAQASADVHRLIEELLAEQLIIAVANASAPSLVLPSAPSRRYIAPHLNIYRGMMELLALEPPTPALADIARSAPVVLAGTMS